MFGDYYLFGIIEGILSKVPQITPNSYLYQDLVSFNFYVVLCAVVVYYVKLVIHKNKTLVFEKDLSQSFTWVEKLYTLVLYGSVGLPIVYIIAGLVHSDTQFYELVANLYVESGVMTGLTVVGIILTIINLVSRLINPNRNFDFKEMEI